MTRFHETLILPNTEDVLDVISAMRRQEDCGYRKVDYLNNMIPQKLHQRRKSLCPTFYDENTHNIESDNEFDDVDRSCHLKMTAWCYQVTKFCKFDKETVEIAMSYLIRFMATTIGGQALYDRSMYQLASMTCFYIAVKIHEPIAMDPKLVANLSSGVHSIEEVEMMESIILTALSWRLNPPTSLSFCRNFLELLPFDTINDKENVYEIVQIQIEFATRQCYELMWIKSSTIAFCSILNAIEFLFQNNAAQQEIYLFVYHLLRSAIDDSEVSAQIISSIQHMIYPSLVSYTRDNSVVIPVNIDAESTSSSLPRSTSFIDERKKCNINNRNNSFVQSVMAIELINPREDLFD
jgi:Cyclin, N-terminal domain